MPLPVIPAAQSILGGMLGGSGGDSSAPPGGTQRQNQIQNVNVSLTNRVDNTVEARAAAAAEAQAQADAQAQAEAAAQAQAQASSVSNTIAVALERAKSDLRAANARISQLEQIIRDQHSASENEYNKWTNLNLELHPDAFGKWRKAVSSGTITLVPNDNSFIVSYDDGRIGNHRFTARAPYFFECTRDDKFGTSYFILLPFHGSGAQIRMVEFHRGHVYEWFKGAVRTNQAN
ncbi:hypothetical protein M427DRAFT_54260 [Gonapodya prolifera JEL478]|uniref:Uncharacterized protein n=1 Tax=Gonapodya prolifera (strain JEL478) TaxID=1344416 RepID=A0A139AMR6_GONPJ|nr:hypothetical protein M427DRAFT_54260 [Gonapodya prolifera JEL478]|eukprot:KXS18052.1 hypothetical protein M427DRAFT_54260 [Gonapodya prolifera JEL478]